MRSAVLAAAVCCLAPTIAVGQIAPVAPIEQTALARDAFSTGLLDRNEGALDSDLWRGSDAQTIAALMAALPDKPASPAIGAAFRRLLLSQGETPLGSTASLGGRKLSALITAGFVDEARTIDSLSAGGGRDATSIEAMAIGGLLVGEREDACAKARGIGAAGDSAFWVKLRVVCYAVANELDAAELALGILKENLWIGERETPIFALLAAGARPDTPFEATSAVEYAAIEALGAPYSFSTLERGSAGVVKALARNAGVDWAMRLAAARRAAAMGVMSGNELRKIYSENGENAAAFHRIRALTAPEFMRDKSAAIFEELRLNNDFESLFATALLYADDLRELEGLLVPIEHAQLFSLARLAVGDPVGAERWLGAISPDEIKGAPESEAMRFIDLVGILAILEPTGAARLASLANISVAAPRFAEREMAQASADLALLVSSAIAAAADGRKGESALAALAASSYAATGDPIAEAVVTQAFAAAGMDDIVKRRAVERAIASLYPVTSATLPSTVAPAKSVAPGLTPRLKPDQSS